MERTLWDDNVRKVVPYIPGEQPKALDVVKLNTNENPFPPSPSVKKVMDEYDESRMRLYPDTNSTVLVEALAEKYGVSSSEIFVGVGSDDVISMAFLTFFNSDKPIFFPDVTYSFYDVWADVYRIPYEKQPLDDNYRIVPKDYKKKNGGIIFPNPNAPTGVLESLETIEDIIMANPDVVVMIDEAYIDFGGESCIPLTKKYDNLLVIQTFSKSRSMAGMRIGYAIGNEKLIKYLNDVKFSINSYTMNPLSQLCGAAAVKDDGYFTECNGKIIATREKTKERLSSLGFVFTDSKSNFIFAEHTAIPADYIFDELKKRRIFVRHWNAPRISDRLRITVGTDAQMDILITALDEIIRNYGKE